MNRSFAAHALAAAPVTLTLSIASVLFCGNAVAQDGPLTVNDREYFERRGLNVLVFSSQHR